MIYILGGLLIAALFCIAGLLYALGKARGENKPVEIPKHMLSEEEQHMLQKAEEELRKQWANIMAYNGSRQEE